MRTFGHFPTDNIHKMLDNQNNYFEFDIFRKPEANVASLKCQTILPQTDRIYWAKSGNQPTTGYATLGC